MNTDHRQRLMGQVAQRQRLAAAGVAAFWTALALEAAAIVWLAGARLLSLWPERLSAPGLAAGLAAALILGVAAWAFSRRPAALALARLIDRRADGKDLFLTAAMLDHSPGEYQPVVLRQAQERAETIRAATVLPFRWRESLGQAASLGVAVTLLAMFLPKLDPLGLNRQRRQTAQQRERLQETRRATQERAAVLQPRPADEARVGEAIARLEQTFRQAEPVKQQENRQRLADSQKELGEMWRQASDRQTQAALQPSQVEQSFGRGDPLQTQQWKEAMRRGDASGLKKELAGIQKRLTELAKQPDSAERRQEQEQLKRQLGALADAASKALQSPGLNAALSRAMDQLSQGKTPQLSQEAMQAAAESLGLSQQELDSLAQSMREMQDLDKALQSAQLARQLNEGKGLNGETAGACDNIGDYAKLFAQQLAASRRAVGPGMGQNGGPGAGGHAPTNDGAQSGFETQKAPSTLNGGKITAQWQTSEVSDPGQLSRDYQAQLPPGPQSVSEAITQEQVPPGYHDAIRKYFDALPVAAAPAPAGGGAGPVTTGQR